MGPMAISFAVIFFAFCNYYFHIGHSDSGLFCPIVMIALLVRVSLLLCLFCLKRIVSELQKYLNLP